MKSCRYLAPLEKVTGFLPQLRSMLPDSSVMPPSLSAKRLFSLTGFAAVIAAIVFAAAWPAFAQKEAKGSIESKIALESSMENRLRKVLTEITGTEKIIIIVNVQLAAEKKEEEEQKKEDDFILPGVPIKEAINEKKVGDAVMAALGEDTRTLIKKLTVTIILDKGVSQSVVDVVKEVATGLLGVDAARGDQLTVKQMHFQKNPFYWGMLIYPPNIYWIAIIIAAVFFISSLIFFLFGPFKGLSGEFVKGIMAAVSAIKESGKSAQDEAFAGSSAAAQALSAPEAGTKETLLGRGEPFSFINEGNINSLMHLIGSETSANIAAIVNYLPAPLGMKVLTNLAPEKQKEAGTLLAQVKELDSSELDSLEAKIKKRIGYLSGGAEKLTNILDYADDKTKNTILSSLKAANPQVAEKVQKSLVSLDILAQMDAPSISTLIRALTPAAFGQVIKTLNADLQKKILEKLPAGAAARLSQEMEMTKAFNPARLETEKRRLVDIIRKLEARGMINRE